MDSKFKLKSAKLSLLSSEESSLLKNILDAVCLGGKDRDRHIKLLSTYPLRLVYALAENSAELNSIMDSDIFLNGCWARQLKFLGYPYHEIVSFDKADKLTLFSQLKGAFLMSEFNNNPDLENPEAMVILNKACDIGMFSALVKRLKFYSNMLAKESSSAVTQKDIKTCMEFILKDVQKLSNLYWTIGCIDSALILFNVVNCYYAMQGHKQSVEQFFMAPKFSWLDEYDHESPYPITVLKVAIENLYIAQLLCQVTPSKRIIDEISHGKGLFSSLEQSFSSFEELQSMVVRKLTALHVPLIESFCRNAFIHAVKTINQYYPELELPHELPERSLTVKS